MDIQKMVEIEILYAQYGPLLTDKQRDILSMYYEEDYSLGEISNILGTSRQSIFDSLKRSEKSLRDYEDKLGMVKKLKKIDIELYKLADKAKEIDSKGNSLKDANQFIELIDERSEEHTSELQSRQY